MYPKGPLCLRETLTPIHTNARRHLWPNQTNCRLQCKICTLASSSFNSFLSSFPFLLQFLLYAFCWEASKTPQQLPVERSCARWDGWDWKWMGLQNWHNRIVYMILLNYRSEYGRNEIILDISRLDQEDTSRLSLLPESFLLSNLFQQLFENLFVGFLLQLFLTLLEKSLHRFS